MRGAAIIMVTVVVSAACTTGWAGPIQTFTDLDSFLAAAGDVHEIDFETLPDGSPTIGLEELTPGFNYTSQGVTFLAHLPIGKPNLYLNGNPTTGFALIGTSYPQFDRNWLIADFVVPATAVGILFPGSTTLTGFDHEGRAVGTISGGGGGPHPFVGIVYSGGIASATIDTGLYSASIEGLLFTPVPEPASVILLALGAGSGLPVLKWRAAGFTRGRLPDSRFREHP